MKLTYQSLLACLALLVSPLVAQEPELADVQEAAVETEDARDARMNWWREARLGMFVHYGLYSGLAGDFKGKYGGGEWIQCNLGLDTDTYAAEALPLFKPAPGCVEKWLDLAQHAGCRYAVLTSKHHEGFALFDSDTTEYDSQALVGRDLVREFADGCRSRGLKVGFYHSVIDWHHPDYDYTICRDLCYPKGQAAMLEQKAIPRNHDAYCTYMHTQVREIMTRYGTVDIMWWDYSQGDAEGDRGWKATELVTMCREINPGVIMNNRLFNSDSLAGIRPEFFGNSEMRGDFYTPEKIVPETTQLGDDWETCLTVGRHWGYSRHDNAYKTPAQVISIFQECLSKGGNLLLNVNPRADGSIPEQTELVFRRLGDWMKVNGEAVYGSSPVWDIDQSSGIWMTVVWDNVYVFLPAWEEGDDADEMVLRLPAALLDAISPSILGQPDCEVGMERVEEEQAEDEDEPQVFMEFTIPVSAWQNAVEGLPVLKLSNDN